jgi:hypothetical protein
VPQTSAQASKPNTIPFRCDGCGKTFQAPLHMAGKSGTCKACGQAIRIPAAAGAAATAAAPRPKAAALAQVATPPPADIYGFDDGPSSAPTGKGREVELDGHSSSSKEEALPQRLDYKPLSAEKKKQIAKRAAKIDRSMPSYAGAGMASVGSVILVVALIGWRAYRIAHRVTRLGGALAVATADDDDKPMDPRTAALEGDKSIEEMMKQPETAEAREWLDPKFTNHAVMEMDMQRARDMVAGFYDRGAEKVCTLDATTLGNAVVTSMFAVKLPADPAKRKQCLEWEVNYLQGEAPTKDFGQKYLMITTD